MERTAAIASIAAMTCIAALCAGCAGNRFALSARPAPRANPIAAQAAPAASITSELERCVLTDESCPDGTPPFTTSTGITQATLTLQDPDSANQNEPPPGMPAVAEVLPPPGAATIPIDLATVLEVAAGQNPQVSFAQARIREAAAQLRQADVLWLPSLRAGLNYNKHDGRLQDVEGNIIDVSRNGLYSGFGAGAVAAGSPSVPGLFMNFHTRDALFQPRIAERTLAARRQASQAVVQDLLTETAIAYINLLEAMQNRAIGRAATANFQDLADLTASFARSGAGLRSDADRVQTELLLQQIEGQRSEENVQVATARLAQLLGQDPTIVLVPTEPALVPLHLATADQPLGELVAMGLTNRPELAESRLLVAAAAERLRRECYAPLVPSLLVGVSHGWHGGGPGGDLDNFGDRVDVDAIAWWEVRNLGLGEQAAREAARSQVGQARAQQMRMMDQVASEIAQARSQLVIRQGQIALAQEGIVSATDSFRRNAERIRNGQGLPIESLQSVQALRDAQRAYARVVADYNRAQFQMGRALGWPVDATAHQP
jgi:outer membrane protein TolC